MMLWGDKKWYLQGNKNYANSVYKSLETIARDKLYVFIPLLILFLLLFAVNLNTQGLVAYWKFDENTGTVTADSSGNMNTGTIYGASWTSGKLGSALNFNGISNYVDAGKGASLNINREITLIAWVKTTSSGENVITGRGLTGPSDHTWNHVIENGRNTFYWANGYSMGSADTLIGKKPVNDGQWHHVAARANSTRIEVYTDGEYDNGIYKTTRPYSNSNLKVLIGNLPGYSLYFNGAIDEVKIYNRALNASEIKADYLQGAVDIIPPEITATDPANNATNISVTRTITVTFSENIQQGTNYNGINLTDSGNSVINIGSSIIGNILTIDPAEDLDYSELYTVSIPPEAVKDLSDNNLTKPYTFWFTTSVNPVLTTISVSPFSVSLSIGSNQTFTATLKDQFGNPFTAAVNWTSSNISVGTINSKGVFTALEAGTSTVTATNGSVSGAAVTTVATQPAQQVVTFASNGISEPFNMINHPHAAYYNGKTYIAWQGANLDPYITYYDHTIKSWRASTRVADNPLVADSHGTPSIVIDNSGYIHVFYGSHGTNQKHAKSNNPENIGGFTVQTDLVGSYTYPQPIKVRNSIYLFNRAPYVTGESYRIYNGASWGEMNTIITSPTVVGTRTYAGYMELNNNKIHITWVYDYGLDRRNIFYAYLNLADHHMYTINGIDLGTTIDSTEAETYAIVRNTGTNNSNPPFLHIDSNGYPWIFYIEGSGTSFKYFHTRWTGSAWTSPVAITTTDDQYNYLDFIINSVSDVTAYLTSAGGTGLGGDIEKWHWDGFTWSKDQTVLTQSASGKPLNCPVVPFNFNTELEVIFSQYLDENFADTTLKLYAYVGKSTPDTALPQVSSTDPANNENNVPAAKTITVNFNENIQAGANYSSISLKDSNNNPVSISTTESGNALTIDPASALSFNTTYTTTIPVGAVKDMSNNLLESSYSFSFTTSTQPILTSIIIIPYSATVARGTTLTFTASPNDQFGNPFTAQVNWASSNTFVGTINTKGVFTALAKGTSTITATSGKVSGTAVATVTTHILGFVAYWNFDENTGTKVADSSGNGNNGTIYGASWTAGKLGSALKFNGVSNYIDAGKGTSLNINNEITLIAWVKTTSSGENVIAGRGLTGWSDHTWNHVIENGRNTFYWANGYSMRTVDYVTGTKLVNDGQWHHVAARANSTRIEVYTDGEYDNGIYKTTRPYSNSNLKVLIGNLPGYSLYFNGAIDEVKIYNRALNASEIKADYLQGTS